jgi:hypothetical protein
MNANYVYFQFTDAQVDWLKKQQNSIDNQWAQFMSRFKAYL